MGKNIAITCTLVGILFALGGCPPENFPNAIAATIDEVSEVINDDSLTDTERREGLAALGLTQESINAILSTERTNNQYGGSLRTAYDKVVAEQFAELTPDEVQLYGDAAKSAGTGFTTTISDTQAYAIQTLLLQNDLNSPEDVDEFLNSPLSDVPNTIPNGVLAGLFVNFDPSEVIDQIP